MGGRTTGFLGVLGVAAVLGVVIGGGIPRSVSDSGLTRPAATPAPSSAPPVESTTSAVPDEPDLRVAVIGDSYTGGSNEGGTGSSNWVAVMDRAIRSAGYTVFFQVAGLGGAGYEAIGTGGRTFVDAVATEVTDQSDVVMFVGSRNEIDLELDKVEAAARNAYDAARRVSPSIEIVVVGAPWVNESVPPRAVELNSMLARVAAEFGAEFVDPLEDGWFFGPFAELIGADQVHPTDEGHAYMAELMTPLLLSRLAS